MSSFQPHDYAEYLKQTKKYVSNLSHLYSWNGVFWEVVSEKAGEAMAYEWLVENDRVNVSPRNASAAHDAAILWVPELPPVPEDFVIPCTNGYVLISNDKPVLIAPCRDWGVQYSLSCPYEPAGPEPRRFKQFIERVLPDVAVRQRVQEYAGYTLTADARHQRAQLWIGGGANGKGVLANVIQALHGYVAAINLDNLDGFKLSVLIGASLIYCDEAPSKNINEQLLKSLIAGERVFIDRKYRDPLSLCIQGKWLVLGNHLPRIADHSHGFWRRWDIVPFNVTIPEVEQDPLLAKAIIQEELSGVLNWALEGLMRLQKRGSFDPVLPTAMSSALHSARIETNSVKAWCVEDEISCVGSPRLPKNVAYDEYVSWCRVNGAAALSQTQFWIRIRDAFPQYAETKVRGKERSFRSCNLIIGPENSVAMS
ncbi:DNA primase family protein [Burkholderia pseudomallei]|uniref:DNA primase family protein n=1 Tax=Burkholderia pseudomallei TaxID=28450 RepID=UPI0005389890|nr:phage/plasmid primase, P4 family [Burkholderia pseudomallei]KGX39751.1 hypothetical protein Y043_2853 [Burkholderia pseudomallei MSHR2138]KGX47884.1 hypothetical protein Y600_6009 [Burkholderia pseudomallei MSHR3709]